MDGRMEERRQKHGEIDDLYCQGSHG